MYGAAELRLWARRIRPTLGDGSSFLVVTQSVQLFLRIFSSLIVTRLLSPEAYGVIGVITSVSYILVMVSDMGLRAYIIRHKEAGDGLIQTVWTVRVLRCLVLFLVMFIGAGAFAKAYNAPEVATAIRVCAFLFLIEAGSSLGPPLAERRREVIKCAAIDFAKFVFVTSTTIIAALYFRTYWAIVISMFAGAVLGFIISYTLLKGPSVRFSLNRDHVIDLWRFWRIIIPSSIVTIGLTQANVFAVARFFPLEELGRYTLAITIAGAVGSLSGEYIMRVFFPLYAEARRIGAARAQAAYYAARRNMMMFFALGIGGLVGGGELIVRLLYNEDFLGAGYYLSLACLAPFARLFSFPAEQAIITNGFLRVALHANVLRLLWILAAGYCAYSAFGPAGLIVAIFLTEAMVAPYYLWHLHRHGLLRLTEEGLIFAVGLIGAIIGYLVNLGAERLIAAGYLPNF
ncbi:MAG: oligosaccharide flippase family protein [Pseudomonadota bacterium]